MTTVGKKPNGKLCSYQLGKNEVNNNSYFCFTRGNFQLKNGKYYTVSHQVPGSRNCTVRVCRWDEVSDVDGIAG